MVAERKRSRHDAPGTEQKVQAAGPLIQNKHNNGCRRECLQGKRRYAKQIGAKSQRAIRVF
jgi:hypothetical protein